jgi:hypothetical protein
MRNRLTERDITRIVKRVVNEQGENPMPTPSPMDTGKKELIQVLRNHLNSMENDNDFSALGVAQVIYNDCAHWMNKTNMFSSRPGEPTNDRAEFAPDNDY